MKHHNLQQKILRNLKFGLNMNIIHTFSLTLFILTANAYGNNFSYKHTNAASLETSIWESDESNIDELEGAISRIIQENPYSSYGHFLYAKFLYKKYSFDPLNLAYINRVQQLGNQIIALDVNSEFGYIIKSEILDFSGSTAEAISLLQTVESNKSIAKSWRFYLETARILLSNDDTVNAFKYINKSLERKEPNLDVIIPYLIGYLKSYGDENKLLDQLSFYDKKYNHDYIKLNIAQYHLERGEKRKAQQLYASLINSDKVRYEAIVNNALILQKYFNENEKVVSILSPVVNEIKEGKLELPQEFRKNIYLLIGEAYLSLKQVQLAEDSFYSALMNSDNIEVAISHISKRYRDAGVDIALVPVLKRAQTSLPGNPILHAVLAEVYSTDKDSLAFAIREFKNAIILDPEESQYYNGIGLIYYQQNNYKFALRAFQAALLIDPMNSLANYNEACLLSILGKTNEALESLARAVQLNPKLRKLAQDDKDFSNIHHMTNFKKVIFDATQPQMDSTTTNNIQFAH